VWLLSPSLKLSFISGCFCFLVCCSCVVTVADVLWWQHCCAIEALLRSQSVHFCSLHHNVKVWQAVEVTLIPYAFELMSQAFTCHPDVDVVMLRWHLLEILAELEPAELSTCSAPFSLVLVTRTLTLPSDIHIMLPCRQFCQRGWMSWTLQCCPPCPLPCSWSLP